MKNTTTLNIRVGDELLKWVDDHVANGLYKNRSEAVRALLREMVHD